MIWGILQEQSHQVFFGHPLCLIPSTSHVIQLLTQSLSSFCSTCPNYLNLHFLIIRLTGSNPKSCLSSSLFFLSFRLTPHIHLIILISVQFNFNSCSDRPGLTLTAMHQTTPDIRSVYLGFSFNENPFPVRMGKYSWNFFQADLTLAVTAESHPPSASNMSCSLYADVIFLISEKQPRPIKWHQVTNVYCGGRALSEGNSWQTCCWSWTESTSRRWITAKQSSNLVILTATTATTPLPYLV